MAGKTFTVEEVAQVRVYCVVGFSVHELVTRSKYLAQQARRLGESYATLLGGAVTNLSAVDHRGRQGLRHLQVRQPAPGRCWCLAHEEHR